MSARSPRLYVWSAQAVVKEGVVGELAGVMDDSDVEVRINLFRGFVNLVSVVHGGENLVDNGYVKLLVNKAGTDEDPRVQELALIVLYKYGHPSSRVLTHGTLLPHLTSLICFPLLPCLPSLSDVSTSLVGGA